MEYFTEFLRNDEYIIKGPFNTIVEAKSFTEYKKHWLISQVSEEGRYKVVEWSPKEEDS